MTISELTIFRFVAS